MLAPSISSDSTVLPEDLLGSLLDSVSGNARTRPRAKKYSSSDPTVRIVGSQHSERDGLHPATFHRLLFKTLAGVVAVMSMFESDSRGLTKIVTVAALFLLSFLLVPTGTHAWTGPDCPPPSGPVTYSGRAWGVFAHLGTGIADVWVADTGELPPSGGFLSADFETIGTSEVSATAFLSYTLGLDGVAQSEAAVDQITLLAGSAFEVKADFVWSHTVATTAGVSGNSEVTGLSVGGVPVLVSGESNQVVFVPGVFTLVVNEREDLSAGACFSITVNALHFWFIPTGVEIVIAHAHSDIVAGESEPPCNGPEKKCDGEDRVKDFVTGGGWIWRNGYHANFGFVAGYKGDGVLRGNLNYIDHADGMHVKATSVDTYGGSGNGREFTGQATVDGATGYTYTCYVEDNGEPGRNDYYRLSLSNGYLAQGTLAGGNIQIHTHA